MIDIARETPASMRQESLFGVLLGLLIVVCVAGDFFMMPIMEVLRPIPTLAFPLLMASIGCVLAQGCLLAAWLAWSDQPLWERLLQHWTVAAILYLVWVAGLAVGLPQQFTMASAMVGLAVPLVSIAAQLPLWFARQTFGWRLIHGDAGDAGARPLSIRDLMLATALVAVALAPARWVPSPDGKAMTVPGIVAFLAASIISAIALLPAGPLLLRTRRFSHGVLLAGLYAAFWMALPWVVVLIGRTRGLFSPPWQVLAGISCVVLAFAATVILAAATARARGYRLVCGYARSASAPTAPAGGKN